MPSETMSPICTSGKAIKTALRRIDLSSLKMPLVLSLLNQVVSSGGNFFLGIYLARSMPLEGFGLYGIGYGVCMLYVGIGNAVLLTQMMVNMPDRAAAEKEQYAARILCAVILSGLLTLLLTAGVGFIVNIFAPQYTHLSGPVAAIAVASVVFLCNEFFTSYAYIKRKERLALMVNLATMLTLLLGLIVEHLRGGVVTAEKVLLLYALGAAVGSCFAFASAPLPLRGHIRKLIPDLTDAWRQGSWALGGVMVTWIQAQTYTYVLALFLGPAGVGQANTAKIFISPFSFLLPAINKVAVPRLADLRHSNRKRMFKMSFILTAAICSLALLYCLTLLIGLDYISQKLLGRYDPAIEVLVRIWCLVLVVQMFRSGGGILLQVQRKFRALLLLNIPSAIITIAVALGLIQWLGAAGAIWGVVAGEIVLSMFIWKEIRHVKIDEDRSASLDRH
ncbi:MAG: polysaccharide biosynthesis C-terminal domain-containing protein [Pseudomonadota bacterium]